MKLWSIEDQHISEDLAELDRKFGKTQAGVQEDADDQDDDQHDDHNEAQLDLDDDEPAPEDGLGHGPLDLDDVAADQVHGIGNDVSDTDSDDNVNISNDSDMLQVETDQVAEEGGDHPQQPGGDGDTQSQQGGDGGPPAASTRSKRNCAKCCCLSHHNLSLHVRKNVPQPLMLAMQVDMHPKLVIHYKDQWETENLMVEDSLGEMIMSVGGKL